MILSLLLQGENSSPSQSKDEISTKNKISIFVSMVDSLDRQSIIILRKHECKKMKKSLRKLILKKSFQQAEAELCQVQSSAKVTASR